MNLPLRRLVALTVLAALGGTMSCAINPVTGRNELMLISENAEIEMGKSTDISIRQQFGFYDDPKLTAYVEKVARRLVPYLHRKNLEYHFAVLDTPIENAFAAPGGYIYVTRGLLAMMNSEAELSTVIGHELGHVNARHSAREMSKQLLLTGGVVLASVLSKDVAKIAPFMLIGLQVLFLKFSRDDEYQADSLGILYSRAAGYSSNQMIPFFTSIKKLEESAGGGLKLPNFLSTHPLTDARIEEARKQLQPVDGEMDVLRDDFLARMDGLVYENDPRQGYVEGNAFYQPEMKFAFAIPEGWTVQNSPKQVAMGSKDEKAALFLSAEYTDKDPGAYLQEQLTQFSEVQVNEISKAGRRINGLNAVRGVYQVGPKPSEGQTVDPAKLATVNIDCIQKDGFIYTFIGTAAKNDFPAYENAIERTVRSFQPLSDAKRLAIQSRKLAIRRSGADQTLKNFLTGLNIPAARWKTIEFLNSIGLEDRVASGQLIKITN
jgi:predicted Zn-dependent protease